jgi:uncharacterized membrane protein YphA (DoxX/SURF4 family)
MFNKYVILASRLVLGGILLVFGLNKFFWFMPEFDLPADAITFWEGLAISKYMFPLVGLVEVLAGVALLTNRFVPLGLVLMAPVTVNFILFHLFLDLSPNIAAGILALVLQTYLMFAYIDAYRPLLLSGSTSHKSAQPVTI